MESLQAPSKEEFERISLAQKEKEDESKQRAKEQRRESLQALKSQQEKRPSAEMAQELQAAKTIQKNFRGYKARRELQGFGLNASSRWSTALHEAQFRHTNRPRSKGAPGQSGVSLDEQTGNVESSNAKQNWKKMATVAKRAYQGDDGSDSDESSSDEDDNGTTPEARLAARRNREADRKKRKAEARVMGISYFLEMVDLKHRYGSNLRTYHEEWKKSDTNENFFFWLDHGAGKNIELESCPRDRLEREQVRYLSREERQYYLVNVDSEGRLCWAKNGARIDTTQQYRDSINGIVPSDDPTPVFNPAAEPDPSVHDDSDSSDSSLESAREADRAAKYANTEQEKAAGMKKVSHLSTSTIFNKLLRKSVRKNTWIFVADTSFRLYVGIKNSGAFQHSSFLQGSRISAAGLIKIKNGRLSSLSPLSGHYRPPAANFRAFVSSMKGHGVDMTHVSISKSYGVLVGLEVYLKTKKKGKDFMGKLVHGKDKVIHPEETERRKEEMKDKSESAEKERKALEEEEKGREENRSTVKLMKKAGIIPVEPHGQVA